MTTRTRTPGQLRLTAAEAGYLIRRLRATGVGQDMALAVRIRKTSANGAHACLTPHLDLAGRKRIARMLREAKEVA